MLRPLNACPQSKTALQMNYGRVVPRKNIRMPLLVDTIGENAENGPLRWDVPLPNAHLPAELTTASLYELRLDVPVHKMIISEAVSSYDANSEGGCCYGHIILNDTDLVGTVGCAGEILIGAPAFSTDSDISNDIDTLKSMNPDDTGTMVVLARGAFRFCVKEVVSSIPYPIAVVDELLDDEVLSKESGTHEQEEESDTDFYDELTPNELVKEVLISLEKVLNIQYDESFKPLTPLEQSILESASSPEPMAQAIQRTFSAEERLAVYQTFVSSMLDIAPDERDRLYTVGMIAGELANFPSSLRISMLTMTDGVGRLRMVLRELNSILSLDAAKRISKSLFLGISEEKKDNSKDPIPDYDGIGSINSDFDDMTNSELVDTPSTRTIEAAEEARKDLKVGIPTLPPWANQIQNGIRIEYFWNEEEGWCAGTVEGDPIKIMDEIIITVKFDDDNSVHRLPLRGEDKARWRPP